MERLGRWLATAVAIFQVLVWLGAVLVGFWVLDRLS
jgi:hypothetical protein